MSYTLGDQYTFQKVFTNSAGTATDPTLIKLYLREEIDQTELEWTYNASPVSGTHYPAGMNAMVRNGTGDYSVAYVLRKPERITAAFVGTGAVVDAEVITVLVRYTGIDALDPPP